MRPSVDAPRQAHLYSILDKIIDFLTYKRSKSHPHAIRPRFGRCHAVLEDGGKVGRIAPAAEFVGFAGEKVDTAGGMLIPGIIDCHSHMATDGGVNESSQSVTAEVRVGDFIDATDVTIYRQLAGGVTSAHILHGSANTIGGQSQLIKLRWGASPEGLKFEGAKPGVKFALGENVTQASSTLPQDERRFPMTPCPHAEARQKCRPAPASPEPLSFPSPPLPSPSGKACR